MRKPTLEKLSIDYILRHKDPDEIFAKYWNISTHDIAECLSKGNCMSAPYRDDKDPSLGFYINNNKLYARDFSGYFWGDCFDAAAFTIGRGREGKEFGKVLEQIAKDFQLHQYANMSSITYSMKVKKTHIARKRLNFTVGKRDWNINDKVYWYDQFHIGTEILEEYHVYPVQSFYINGLLRYTYDPRNPAYAYYLGEDTDGVPLWKIYKPYARKGKDQKFMQNCAAIEGALHMKKADLGIMIKSYKDVIAAENLARISSLSILALAAPSESTIITQYQYDQIMEYVPILYTLSDYDRTGIKFAATMRRKYDTTPLFFTRGLFGNPDFDAKDLTDNIARWGVENIISLGKILVNQGHHDLLKHIRNL